VPTGVYATEGRAADGGGSLPVGNVAGISTPLAADPAPGAVTLSWTVSPGRAAVS
jgi:hypothetical protein